MSAEESLGDSSIILSKKLSAGQFHHLRTVYLIHRYIYEPLPK